MPTIESDGAAIHYEIDGTPGGPWLMLSNSLGTNLSMWDDQVEALADGFRILRYDSRGHGRSSVPEGPYTIDQLGRDALALLDTLGIEKTHFCGLSKGGMVGQWLGVNAPGRIVRLALCNTAAHLPPRELWDERIETAATRGMEPLTETIIERWLSAPFRETHPEAVERVRRMLLATRGAGYAGCCAAIRDMDQRAAIGRISAPTLVIGGTQDPATPPDKSKEIADAIGDSRLVMFDTAHLSNIETGAAYTRTLREFLEED